VVTEAIPEAHSPVTAALSCICKTPRNPRSSVIFDLRKNGAGDEIRTHDFNLGKRQIAMFANSTVVASSEPESAKGRRLAELSAHRKFEIQRTAVDPRSID